jgi:hypothetical protein
LTEAVHQVFDHHWPSGSGEPIAILGILFEPLGVGRQFALEEWEEDGLGPARGFWCRLPSGRIVLLWELEATRGEYLHGIHVSVDSGELREREPRQWLAELFAALGLPEDVVLWTAAAEPAA